MEENIQLQFLKGEILKRINGIDGSRTYYRKKAFYLYMSTTVMAALVTTLLGLNWPAATTYLQNVSLGISALITVISAYNSFFNHRELWVSNNSARNKFYQLEFDIQFRQKDATPFRPDEIEKFKDRYQAILDELNTMWAKSRASIV